MRMGFFGVRHIKEKAWSCEKAQKIAPELWGIEGTTRGPNDTSVVSFLGLKSF
jgi:hypothetical protein